MEEMKKGNYWHGLISLSSSKKNCLWLFFKITSPVSWQEWWCWYLKRNKTLGRFYFLLALPYGYVARHSSILNHQVMYWHDFGRINNNPQCYNRTTNPLKPTAPSIRVPSISLSSSAKVDLSKRLFEGDKNWLNVMGLDLGWGCWQIFVQMKLINWVYLLKFFISIIGRVDMGCDRPEIRCRHTHPSLVDFPDIQVSVFIFAASIGSTTPSYNRPQNQRPLESAKFVNILCNSLLKLI